MTSISPSSPTTPSPVVSVPATRPGGASWPLSLAILLNRCSLGLYLLLAGVAKVRGGVSEFYESGFVPMKPPWLPEWFASPYGHAVPFLEILVGGLLILGWLGRLMPLAAFLMITSFTIALAGIGQFFNGPGPFSVNVILITLALLLIATGPGRISLGGGGRNG